MQIESRSVRFLRKAFNREERKGVARCSTASATVRTILPLFIAISEKDRGRYEFISCKSS